MPEVGPLAEFLWDRFLPLLQPVERAEVGACSVSKGGVETLPLARRRRRFARRLNYRRVSAESAAARR